MVTSQKRKRLAAGGTSPGAGAIMIRGKDDGCCGIYFLKNVLYMFNFVLLLSGAAMLGVGLWTLLVKNSFASLLATVCYQATSYLLIGTGAAVVLVVFSVGCCGVYRENTCGLMTFATFLMLVFLLEAGTGVLAYMYETLLTAELTRSLNHTMLTSYKRDKARTEAIDSLQRTFRCCGAGSFLDWPYSDWLQGDNRTRNQAPDSCCLTESPGCAKSNHPSNIFYRGCLSMLENYLREHLVILGAVGLGFCCIQIFGIIFSCYLVKKLKKWNERKMYWR